MRSTSDSSSSLTISCDFDRDFHSACPLRGHFLRRAVPRLRLSVLDGATAVSKLMLPSYVPLEDGIEFTDRPFQNRSPGWVPEEDSGENKVILQSRSPPPA